MSGGDVCVLDDVLTYILPEKKRYFDLFYNNKEPWKDLEQQVDWICSMDEGKDNAVD